MAAAELPDDPEDWPSDPFAVLGVSRGAADADVKRAYVRLIKRFKPEHHPEQFRRVREAYETCRIQAAWYRNDETPADEPVFEPIRHTSPAEASREPDPPPVPDPATRIMDEWRKHDSNSERKREPEPPPKRSEPEPPPSRVESASGHWERLIDGPDPDAFAGLLAEAEANPDRADLSLRLYWLLAFHPALDPDRTRHHWLARALHQSRFRGPAAELYRRELDTNPKVALAGAYRDLLAQPASTADLSAVALPRIAAAGRLHWWGRLREDLDALTRLRMDDDAGWLTVLVAAHDWSAWEPDVSVTRMIADELRQLRHLELQHSWQFDRVDSLRGLASGLWSLSAGVVPAEAVTLVQSAVATNGHPTAAQVEAAAEAVVADARRQRPAIVVDAAPVGVLARVFEEYLGRYAEEDEDYPPPLMRAAAAARLWRLNAHGYAGWRPHVLQFLLEERIDPREFAAVLKNDNSGVRRGLAKHLAADTPLRAVWLASRIVEG